MPVVTRSQSKKINTQENIKLFSVNYIGEKEIFVREIRTKLNCFENINNNLKKSEIFEDIYDYLLKDDKLLNFTFVYPFSFYKLTKISYYKLYEMLIEYINFKIENITKIIKYIDIFEKKIIPNINEYLKKKNPKFQLIEIIRKNKNV